MSCKIIRVPLSSKKIRGLYDGLSTIYNFLTRYEIGSLKKALEIAEVKEGSKVLEVGFGTGRTLVYFSQRVGDTGNVYGVDISLKMVDKTRRLVERRGVSRRAELALGDARRLPFSDNVFDVIFNSYMFDLVDTPRIPGILSDFERVLKPGGRLVLVNLSKGSQWHDDMRFYEWIYRRSPSLLGGCRPVLLTPYLQKLGFKEIKRLFMRAGHIMPTEIILTVKDRES